MDVKTFVSDTLVQIIDGILDAQSKIKDRASNATINPEPMGFTDTKSLSAGRRIEDIDFDIALSIESSGTSDAKVSVIGGLIGGKVEAGIGNNEGKTHRVKFSVPVKWPG